jgi:glycosyltransferase involved in cell wall biosynthesis
MAGELNGKKILIIVENLPVPPDRRVWQEAKALKEAGCEVSVICPTGRGYHKKYEILDGIHIFRHPLPLEADGALGYLFEYSSALFWEFILAWRVLFARGFYAIHACNPPDTIFMVGLFFKLLGKKFVFDHHDLSPELYVVKFGKKGFFYRMLLLMERLTFWTATVSIATNESYKRVAIERGGCDEKKVFVVRSAPDMSKLTPYSVNKSLYNGRKQIVGYVGVMAVQDGIDGLLRIIKILVKDYGYTDAQLVLIGGGTELENLKKYVGDLGISEFVTFTGWLKGDELIAALNTIDVGVAPDMADDYNDKCTMNKIMEYMALGKPVVQYDVTEGRYSAQEASLYADKNDESSFANKLFELLNNKELREKMGLIGKKRMEEVLDWKYEKPKLIEAYKMLFNFM